MNSGLLWLAVVWIIYFLLHSLFASLAVKRCIAAQWPNAVRSYRLAYNIAAVILLIPPLGLMVVIDGTPLWQWRGVWAWFANGIAIVAIAGFFWSLRFYDSGTFLGLRQLSESETAIDNREHLTISPLHRVVRHPWYFLALLVIWTRDMDSAFLVTGVVITAYFVIGSRLEESKLIALYGDAYREYIKRVPGLLPLPWKILSLAAARALENQATKIPPATAR